MRTLLANARAWGRPPRVMGIDVARGLAILGMMAAHLVSVQTLEWSDPSTWNGIVTGRSSLLFALLAGVALTLVLRNPRYSSTQGRARFRLELLGRGMAIFAIGMGLELLNTPIAIILTMYGVLFLAAIPFLWLSTKWLLVTVYFLAALGPALLEAARIASLGAAGPGVSLLLLNSYSLAAWLVLLLMGIVLGRQNLASIKVAFAAIAIGLLLAIGGYLSGHFYSQSGFGGEGTTEYASSISPDGEVSYLDQLRGTEAGNKILGQVLNSHEHSGATMEIIGSGGFVLVVVGLCLVLAKPLRWLLLPVACIGSLPLTTYSAHVLAYVVLAGGPGQYVDQGLAMWAWNVLWIVVGATVWALTLGKGPLERLVVRAARAMAKGL